VPCFGAGLQLTRENQAAVRRVYDECRQVAPFVLEGNYYPLTPYSRAGSDWLAWQFNRPEKGDGVVQIFRRSESPYVRADFRLRGLAPAAIYEVWNFDVAGTTMIAAKELIEKGLIVEIKDKPGAAVITYRQQKEHGR
jgi:alpha-galactosidase